MSCSACGDCRGFGRSAVAEIADDPFHAARSCDTVTAPGRSSRGVPRLVAGPGISDCGSWRPSHSPRKKADIHAGGRSRVGYLDPSYAIRKIVPLASSLTSRAPRSEEHTSELQSLMRI